MTAFLKPSSSYEVKSKFFNTIGIDSRQFSGELNNTPKVNRNKESLSRRIEIIPCYQESLKEEKVPNKDSWNIINPFAKVVVFSGSDNANFATRKQKNNPNKNVSFQDKVDVALIPMRKEYSKRILSHVWANKRELKENSIRNTVEFISEGMDWRNAVEEDQMYICAATGDRIHPCHIDSDTYKVVKS